MCCKVTCGKREQSGCSAHSNSIVSLQMFTDAAGHNTGRLSTAGWDGRVITWDVFQSRTIKAVHLPTH